MNLTPCLYENNDVSSVEQPPDTTSSHAACHAQCLCPKRRPPNELQRSAPSQLKLRLQSVKYNEKPGDRIRAMYKARTDSSCSRGSDTNSTYHDDDDTNNDDSGNMPYPASENGTECAATSTSLLQDISLSAFASSSTLTSIMTASTQETCSIGQPHAGIISCCKAVFKNLHKLSSNSKNGAAASNKQPKASAHWPLVEKQRLADNLLLFESKKIQTQPLPTFVTSLESSHQFYTNNHQYLHTLKSAYVERVPPVQRAQRMWTSIGADGWVKAPDRILYK